MQTATFKNIRPLLVLTAILLQLVFSLPQNAFSQTCVFETAADLYKEEDEGPQKIYRPTIIGADIQYYESGSIDAAEVKIKAKKVLIIHDEYKGHFLLVHTNEPRCSEGSQLMARPENEEIIVLTKQGELIKGYGTVFPYSENLKIYKDEHHSGDYYRSISSTTEVVFLIYFIDENPDTKFFVTGKELSKYTAQLYDLLIPAFEIPAVASLKEIPTETVESNALEVLEATEIEVAETHPAVEIAEVAEAPAAIEVVEIPESVEVAETESQVAPAELNAEAEEIAEVLDHVSTEEISTEVNSLTNHEIPEQVEPIMINAPADNSLIESETTTPRNTENTPVNEDAMKSEENQPIDSKIEDSAVPIISSPTIVKPKNKLVLSDLEKDELMIKAKEKVETLGGCFEVLASTSAANAFKDDNYKLAVSLFIHDSVEVAVSSLTRNTFKHYKITTYLKRMRTFNYTDVEISFHNVSKVSNLRLNPDGTYTGIITFSQVFRGFIEGKPVYADRTDKNIEIIIRAREVFAGSLEASVEWDVFLGNIGVDQTSAF